MDAILAVVLGGTSLAGGRYSLTGTLIGAFLIQTLTTTVYSMGIAPEVTLVFKALVVMAVVLLQSPAGRAILARRRAATTAATTARQELLMSQTIAVSRRTGGRRSRATRRSS